LTGGKFTVAITRGDYTTELDQFLSPQELWERWVAHEGITDAVIEKLLTPFNDLTGKEPRYLRRLPSTAPRKPSCKAYCASC
jgi:hypothetical protein